MREIPPSLPLSFCYYYFFFCFTPSHILIHTRQWTLPWEISWELLLFCGVADGYGVAGLLNCFLWNEKDYIEDMIVERFIVLHFGGFFFFHSTTECINFTPRGLKYSGVVWDRSTSGQKGVIWKCNGHLAFSINKKITVPVLGAFKCMCFCAKSIYYFPRIHRGILPFSFLQTD